FGATYMVLSPEHPLVDTISTDDQLKEVLKYKEQSSKKTEIERTDMAKDKTGVFSGTYAINPVNNEKIPIWIADYVIMGYGTGAIMAVPAHDERDFDFANLHKIEIKNVIDPDKNIANFSYYAYPSFAVSMTKNQDMDVLLLERDSKYYESIIQSRQCWTGPGKNINSGFLDGLEVEEAKGKIIAWLEKEKKGRGVTTYRLRDWSISRQRYWGAPIPIVYDTENTPHPIPQEHLPWELPHDVEFKPTGTSPLAQSKELKERTEKIFGKGWTPEVDTMDTFVCSSFYQFMYLTAHNSQLTTSQDKGKNNHIFIEPEIEHKWMPIDMYIGGPEHACMHLIYARFVTKALRDFGFVKCDEPFKKLVHQGLITNAGAKMSKSKGNTVSPDEFVEKYGSDAFRMYLMFMGPFTDGGDWSDTGINGIDRFVKRLWRVLNTRVDQCSHDVQVKVHATVKKCTVEITELRFNTAIAALMELLNDLDKQGGISQIGAEIVTKLLAPLAPHLAEELWESIGGKGFVIDQKWPEYDPKLLVLDSVTIVVQVNGKIRGEFEAKPDIAEKDAINDAKNIDKVKKYINGKELKKEIYIPGKLVSFVV
ncbi:MAG: leucine--tRNA ligase, partial [Candidatus Peribacteraceae bacterium]|nr:leucine--tRNA ligase [Candidatus Peribacteraceae bacterium]